jgi:hypothetical protein
VTVSEPVSGPDEIVTIWTPHHGKPGPVHVAQRFQNLDIAWCGVRRQFKHWAHDGVYGDVTCTDCKAAVRASQPRAWRSR